MTGGFMTEKKLLNSQEAGNYIGVKESTLTMWRHNNKGPRYIKVGSRLVKYNRSDLDAFLNRNAVMPELEINK